MFGATTDNSIIALASSIPDFVHQVETFKTYLANPANATVPWKASTTYFSIMFGINDIGAAFFNHQNITELVP